jgi:chromosome partitioning protein
MRAIKRIAVIGEKGGTGKTPTAVNIAVQAAEHGWKPVILDLDHKQASATNWADRRGKREPVITVVPCLPARLKQTLEAIPQQGFDLVVIDTPGRDDGIGTQAASGPDTKNPAQGRADLVLVPCRPILADTDTLPTVKRMVQLAGDPPALVVITAAPIQGNRHETVAEIAEQEGFKIAPVVLFRREAYGDSYNLGLSPTEHEPHGKAAAELIALYDYISPFLEDAKAIEQGAA